MTRETPGLTDMPSATVSDHVRNKLWFAGTLLVLGMCPSSCLISRLRYPIDGWEGAALGVVLWTDTTFAPGYSEEAFARVQPGMSMAQVEALLGSPLWSSTFRNGEITWAYTRSPGDTHFRLRGVIFDAGKKVKEVFHEFYVD